MTQQDLDAFIDGARRDAVNEGAMRAADDR